MQGTNTYSHTHLQIYVGFIIDLDLPSTCVAKEYE